MMCKIVNNIAHTIVSKLFSFSDIKGRQTNVDLKIIPYVWVQKETLNISHS